MQVKIIDVLGLGETILDYKPGNETVGVNDIFKFHKIDHLLVMDKPNRFSKERLSTILLSTPKKFYSNVKDETGYVWEKLVKNFVPIETERGRGFVNTLDSKEFSISNNSTFTACVLAYKLGAKKIVMYGVDFINHPHLSAENSFSNVLNHFKTLKSALNNRGVELFVSSKKSRLSEIIPVY